MSSHKVWQICFSILLLVGLIFCLVHPGGVKAAISPTSSSATTVPKTSLPSLPLGRDDPLDKIEPTLLEELALAGRTEFFVWMVEKANLSPAYGLETKEEKGRFVFETLRETAERTQRALCADLDRQGIDYQPFYIANKVLVRDGDQTALLSIASRSDVARITANHKFQLEEPIINPHLPDYILAIEPNISFVNADDVWALGYIGSGVVLAGNDTGLDWDHPAIINQYRGWNGVSADHNYNWWDATGTYPTAPYDGHSHGTHTTGTMVGDDGVNQIGMAPGACAIHCKNMTDSGYGSDATFIECFEWDLAPWDLNGTSPRPDLAPDAINNSWGHQSDYRDEITALQAAGILVEASAGNSGPGCSTVSRPPGAYLEVLTTGSVQHTAAYPGTITGFSSRGPSTYDGNYVPDVMAPGENIRSSMPGTDYGYKSGTSMSGPHVTGLIGLMWSANPGLRGLVTETVQIILDTAVPLTGQIGSNCGGDYTTGPNNDWGYGTIDALAAVQQAMLYGGTGTLVGTVIDTSSQTPIADASIQATLSPALSWQTASGALGDYALQIFSGTYTVTTWAYGYQPQSITGVSVISGTTTTLPISLTLAPSYVVSGTVTDAVTGWPLYARINIDGYPGGTVWTDPVTGFYSVTLAGDINHIFDAEAWVPGYNAASRVVGPLTGNRTEDFGLTVDSVACTAPGYTPTSIYLEDFENGFGNWLMTGLWNPENEGDTCGAQVAPFPSSSNDAYYGLDGVCTYADGSANSGELTMITPVTLPPSGSAVLSFWSYEQTECGGDCTWDNRFIEISNDGGGTWTVLGEGDTEGSWYPNTFDLTPYLGSSILIRFRFDTIDSAVNGYFGWMVDNVTIQAGCTPTSGGLVVGNVYDANTNTVLNGATVSNDSGKATITAVTLEDMDEDSGFYTLFSPAGAHVFTATLSGYELDVLTVTVVSSDTVQQDFTLPAGWLSYAPTGLGAALYFGESTTIPFTLTNDGSVAASFELQEKDKGFILLAQPSSSGQLYAERNDDGYANASIQQIGVVGSASYWATTLNADPELSADYTFVDLGNDWTYATVQDYDGILVNESDYGLTADETAALRQYYDAGGPVLLGMDDVDNEEPAEQADVYHIFGVTNAQDGNFYVGSLNPVHPIAEGVMLSSMGNDNDHFDENDATWVVRGDDGNDYVLARDSVARSAILGEQMSQWWSGGNDQLVRNAIKWAIQAEVPWLSQAPITGTIAPSASQVITITFDASVPGIVPGHQYYAELKVADNTPYAPSNVPVTMTVTPPPTWGKLTGIVQSLGYCDANTTTLEGAEILIENGAPISLATDISGTYSYWLEQGVYTVTVSHSGHLTKTAVVTVTAQTVVTHDVDLRWAQPCVSAAPSSIGITLDMGISTTLPLTLSNTGASVATYQLTASASQDDSVLLLHLDEPAGATTFYDSSGHNHHGSCSGFSCPTAGVAGKLGTTLSFDGDDYVTLANAESLPDGTNPRSMCGWAKTNTTASGWRWIAAYGSPQMSQAMFIGLNGTTLHGGGYMDDLYLNNFWNIGNWHHVCLTYDGITAWLYADGVEVASGAKNWNLQHSQAYIGRQVNDSEYWNGTIDQVVVYDRVLSAQEVQTLYNLDRPGSGNVPWLSTDPITGTVSADGGLVPVDVTLNAAYVAQPGEYHAMLGVSSNDPINDYVGIPVTMTINVPATWGKLQGTIAGLGYCDANATVLEGAEILIENGTAISLTTDVSGTYSYWLEQGTYTVTASHIDHLPNTTLVTIAAQTTTTQNIDLPWVQPCVSIAPQSFDATLDTGTSTTLPMAISNNGAAALEIEIADISCQVVSGQSAQTLEDLDDTYSYPGRRLKEVYLYAYSSDNDTLDAFVTAYNVNSGNWDTLYYGSGGTRLILDQAYDSQTYSQIRVQLDDTEGNDTIYYDYSFEWCAFLASPWLSVAPTTATVPPYSVMLVNVTLDAGQVNQPGVYTSNLQISSNDPYIPIVIAPVTMTANPSPTWGKLTGVAYGLGHCDANLEPLADAAVHLSSGTGITWTTKTSNDGAYQLWMDQAASPLTAIVSYPDHITQTVTGIIVTGQTTTTLDFDLRLSAPCIRVAPSAVSATLALDRRTTRTLTISNTGALESSFVLRKVGRGSSLLLQSTPSVQIGVVGSSSSWATTLNADPDLSSDYGFVDLGDNWTYSTIQGYDAILVNESDQSLTVDETAALRQYYDAGGSVLLGMDDLDDEGYVERTDVYYIFGVSYAQDGDFYVGSLNPAHPIAQGVTLSDLGMDNDHFYENGATWVVRGNDLGYYVLARDATARTVIFGERVDQWWAMGNEQLVRNAIRWAVPIHAPWLSLFPISGVVGADSAQSVDVVFDSHILAQTGQYYATVIATSDDPVNHFITVPVTLTISAYGVTLDSPVPKSGDPGTTVTHTLRVTNNGLASDAFDVITSGHNWPVTTAAVVGPLSTGEWADVEVVVTIPITALGQAQDEAIITVRSQGDSCQSASATLSTIANNVYGVVNASPFTTKMGLPGTLVSYTLRLTNTGNTSDTFCLSASGNQWPTAVSLGPNVASTIIALGPIAARASDEVEIVVMIPPNVAFGDTDTVTVTLTSQGDSAQSSTAVLRTRANCDYLFISKKGPSEAEPGERITYTLTITNNGSGIANNLLITDTIPSGANYVTGGTQGSDVVTWTVDTLAANGGTIQVSFVVTATSNIINSDYRVRAENGCIAAGDVSVITRIPSGGPDAYNVFLPLVFRH